MLQRNGDKGSIAIAVWESGRQAIGNGGKARVRSRYWQARPEPRHGAEIKTRTIRVPRRWRDCGPHLRLPRKLKTGRHYTDDLVSGCIDTRDLAYGGGRGAEVSQSKCLADDSSAARVGGRKRAAGDWRHLEDVEEIGIGLVDADEFRAVAELHTEFAAEKVAERLEGIVRVANILQVAAGDGLDGTARVGPARVDGHEPF